MGRFRARSLERVRQICLSLVELEEQRGGEAVAQEVAREMHTLKGDSRIIGAVALAEMAHAIETLLFRGGVCPPAAICIRVRVSLELMATVFREELVGEAADAALTRERQAVLAEIGEDTKVAPGENPAA